MADVARAGIDLLPILFTPPPFRADGRREREERIRPTGRRTWAEFASRLVRRYGPDGQFWASNPDLPYHPIRAWQVWNEPNLPVYWPNGPDPAEYVGSAEGGRPCG